MFLETTNSIVFNTGGLNASSATPDMIISSNGYVGIGTNAPQINLDIRGIINTSNGLNTPQTGSYGSNGERIILSAGGTGIYPSSIGISSNSQWYSVPTSSNHVFYIGGSSIFEINSVGSGVTGNFNCTILSENGVSLTNKYLKLDGTNSIPTTSVTRAYPPRYLSGVTTTITNTSYGLGVYVATAGSDYSGQEFFYCLGGNPMTTNPVFNQWTSGFGNFNTSGNFVGARTTLINGVSTSGETATLVLPYLVVVTSYKLTSAMTPYHYYMMRDWVFCGSTDGTNYTQLDSQQNILFPSYSTNTYNISNTTPYTYYRFVIKKTSNYVGTGASYSATVCDGITFFGYEIINGLSIGTIGIGTAAANNAVLNVSGTATLTGNLGIGTIGSSQNQISIYTSASTSSNQILITSTSNSASIQLNNGVTSNAFIGIGCPNIAGNYSNNMFLETTNSIVFNTGGVNASSVTPDMIILSNGFVGINTNNPTARFHVNGIIKVSDFSGTCPSINLHPGTTTLGYIEFFNTTGTRCGYIGWGADLTNYISLAHENTYLGYLARGNFIVNSRLGVGNGTAAAISGTNALTVTGTSFLNGVVGIGTDAPQNILEVYKAGTNEAFIRISGNGGANNTCGINFKNTSTRGGSVTAQSSTASIYAIDDGNSSSHLALGTAATGATTTISERMRILNNGNIGIGTTNPIQKLHVQAATPSMIRVETTVDTVGEISGIEFGIPAFSSANSAKITSTTISGNKANLQFFTTNGFGTLASRMIINETGSIGIGTTNPGSYILNVNGTSAFQNSIRTFSGLSNTSTRPALSTTPIAGEIRGTNVATTADDGFIRISAGGYTNSGIVSYIDITGYSTVADMDKTIVLGTAGAERMRITNGGSVGIGTNSPQTFLDVRGTIYVKGSVGTAAPGIGTFGGTGERIILWAGQATQHPYALGIDGGTMWYSVPTGAIHNFFINGSSIAQINSAGLSVSGITATSLTLNTNSIVSVGNITSTGNITTSGNISISGSTGYLTLTTGVWHRTTDSINRFFFNSNGATYFRSHNQAAEGWIYNNSANTSVYYIRDNGNVGIGTAGTNQNQISIYTTASTSSNQILITSTSNSASIQLNNGITSNAFIGIGCSNTSGNYSNNMFLETNNSIVFNAGSVNASSATPVLIISSNGNVGIKTNNPTSALTVIGNTSTSTLNVTGIATIATNNWITSSDSVLRIYFANNDSTLFQSPNGYSFRRTDGVSLLFMTNTYNIGINTTTNTTYALDIYHPSSTANVCRIQSGTTNGYMILSGGIGGSLGYVNFHKTNGSRVGYIGYGNNLANYIDLTSEDTFVGYAANGNLVVGSKLAVGNGMTAISGTNALNVTGTSYLSGNVGIGTNSPVSLLDVRGRIFTQTMSVVDSTSYTNQYQLLVSPPTSTTPASIQTIQQNIGFGQNLILQGENLSGNVGIGTSTNVTSKLTVNGGISATTIQENGTALTSKYLQLSGGTLTGALNFKIDVWNKSSDNKNRLLCTNNGTTYFGSGNGIYIFKSADDTVDTFKVDNTGVLTTTGNIDCGGGILITGSTINDSYNVVDAGNEVNTYFYLKPAGTGDDWCYIRQIGGTNAYKLAFDFHDDGEARFCIRNVKSTDSPDTIKEVFTVDDGNVTCTSNIGIGTGYTNPAGLIGCLNASNIISPNYSTNIYYYPPSPLINYTTTISGLTYGNGIYTVSVSSTFNAAIYPYNTFNILTDSVYIADNYWITTINAYSTSTGAYSSMTNSTNIGGTSTFGEWIQLQYNNGFVATGINLILYTPQYCSPATFFIVASNDGSNWTLLYNQSTPMTPATDPRGPYIFSWSNTTSYTYYRLIILTISTVNASGYKTFNGSSAITNIAFFNNNSTSLTTTITVSSNFNINNRNTSNSYTNLLGLDATGNLNTSGNITGSNLSTSSFGTGGFHVINMGIGYTGLANVSYTNDTICQIISNGATGIKIVNTYAYGYTIVNPAYAANKLGTVLFYDQNAKQTGYIGFMQYPNYIDINCVNYTGSNYYGYRTNSNFVVGRGLQVGYINPTNASTDAGTNALTVNGTSYFMNNIGIGTNASAAVVRLDVSGKINVSNGLAAPSIGVAGGTGDRIILYPGDAAQYPYSIGVNTTTYWFSCPSNVNYIWFTSNVSNMFLDTTGTLTVNNDVIGFNSASDIKLKTNIRPLNIDCSDLISKIKPVEFNWKDIDSIPIEKRNKLDYGFIAQDIEKILPHLVKDITSHKIIKYEKFAPYLVKAIQEINNKLDKLIPNIEPNIYSICECSKNIIKLLKKDILKLYINCFIEIINNEKTNKYQVIDINLTKNIIKIDKDLEGNKCFIYGIYNDSFETFDKYNHLNITEKLYSIINKQQEQIDNLIEKLDKFI